LHSIGENKLDNINDPSLKEVASKLNKISKKDNKMKKISEAKAKLEARRINSPDEKLRQTLTELKEGRADSSKL
jgi:hypothetical protein